MDLLIYEGKVAVALLVFYLFYRFLLKKETFHRFNRVVLVGTAVLSFLLPLCIITIRKPVEMDLQIAGQAVALPDLSAVEMASVAEPSAPWWQTALTVLFWAGVAFVLVRVVVSILCIARIVRKGECVREEDGCKVIVTDRDLDPFSWMRFIVLSRKDWEGDHTPILAHEKAHIAYRHSVELLLVDVMSALQWFNPAIWMLRADLQELHEYEADDAVLRSGANLREYQYLLIRKAVSKSGYSVANSFNHSILKNRITMMSRSKSSRSRGWRALYLLLLICLGIGLQARTVYVPKDNNNYNSINAIGDQGDVKKIVTIKVDAQGRIVIDDKEVPMDGIADYLQSLGLPGREIGVSIEQVQDTPEEVMTELKNQLRQAGVLKVQARSYTRTPFIILQRSSGEVKEISKEEMDTLDEEKIASIEMNLAPTPDLIEKYGEKVKDGVMIIHYQEDKTRLDPLSKNIYLTPFEFSTLVSIDMDGERITDFRRQKSLTAGKDEFLGLCVRELPQSRSFDYVARPVGGKPIQAIQWQSPPASTHVLYINGKSIGELQKDEGLKKDEVMLAPRFQYGTTHQFDSWVHAHLEYPQRAREAGIEGVVLTSYDVCEDGEVRNVKVLVGINDQLDAEAVRVISSSPRWEPAMMNNKPVKVSIQLPVVFTLNESGDNLPRQDGDDSSSFTYKRTENEAIPVVRFKRGDGEPLVVVNGERLEGGVNAIKSIDPATIVSMEVRKDSIQVAHYGPEAESGVIWINTTKNNSSHGRYVLKR